MRNDGTDSLDVDERVEERLSDHGWHDGGNPVLGRVRGSDTTIRPRDWVSTLAECHGLIALEIREAGAGDWVCTYGFSRENGDPDAPGKYVLWAGRGTPVASCPYGHVKTTVASDETTVQPVPYEETVFADTDGYREGSINA